MSVPTASDNLSRALDIMEEHCWDESAYVFEQLCCLFCSMAMKNEWGGEATRVRNMINRAMENAIWKSPAHIETLVLRRRNKRLKAEIEEAKEHRAAHDEAKAAEDAEIEAAAAEDGAK